MNAIRRLDILNVKKDITSSLEDVRSLFSTIAAWKDLLGQIRDDEQEYYDNMPASLKQSEKGDLAENAIIAIEEAISKLDDFVPLEDILDEILPLLETAAE